MPQLVRTIKKLEDVAAPLREFYVADDTAEDGGFVLDIEGYEDPTPLKNSIKKLKGALEKERENGKLAAKIKKRFPDMDDDEVDAEIEKALKGGGKSKGGKEHSEDEIERIVEKRVAEKMKEVEPKLKEADTFKGELRTERIDNALRAALVAAGVKPERLKAALTLAKEEGGIDLSDDFKTVVLKDKDGDPRGVTLEKWAGTEFKKVNPFVFEGSGASGSGAQPGVRNAPADPSKMSAVDKINVGLAARGK